MKFGKELSCQMVPEWQKAYMDYNSLQKLVEELIRSNNAPHPHNTGINRKWNRYCAFSGLLSTSRRKSPTSPHDVEEGVHSTSRTSPMEPILVNTSAARGYETEGGEYELVFFRRLDEEFNKVDKFYKERVEEVMKEAEMLNKQMDALIAFRLKVEHLDGETVNEVSMRAARPAPIDVLDRVSMNDTKETPRSTIKGILKVSSHTELNFSKENMRKVEERLKRAFIEFYHKLRPLKSYSFLNVLAFSKILKKYDKVTLRDATKPYMKVVDSSSFGNSDEVMRLMEHVEATFIQNFANAERTKGMNILRPKAQRERHRLTFSTGFSAGCVFSLIVALAAIIRTRHILQEDGENQYMDTMFPLYSLFGFIVLHIIMYAGNVYYWKRYRVNYSFIFGFKQGTELGYRQVMLVGFSIGVLALLCVLANLDMQVNPKTKDYKAITELLPLKLLIVMFIVLVLPFNFFYRSSRLFFLTCMFHCLAAPLYKVTLPDFFVGDQLTSQVQAFRSIEFYICYYGWGDFKHRKNTCNRSDTYNSFFFIVAVIPYVSRLLQCMRRLFEEKNSEQGYNGIKYFLTIVAICLRTAYSISKGQVAWRVLAVIFSVIAAIYGTYWDFVHDWGLLNRTSKNRWLREKLLIPQKKVYFIAMILNVLLRFAWIQTVLDFKFSSMHRQTMITVVASLEIIRRGICNFFRLENEHLNNVGKFRAFKTVPLPFNYDERLVTSTPNAL